MKRLDGEIISYNATQRCGYIQVEGYPLILYCLTDLPTGYIPPTVGEKLNFIFNDDEGHIYASDIVRPEIKPPQGVKAKLKGIQHAARIYFYEQPKTRQKKIIIAAISLLILCITLIMYASVSSYQNYQQRKAEQFQREQQQAINQQRAALGDLQEGGLSEEAKRNLDAKVYGTVRERSDTVTRGIDKLNGLLPVSSGRFKCDERKYCHEMRSYEEALYFQRHCRGTRLDNNGNGVPCENDIRWLKK
ncbi:excalibur calcium-binding domain-containing protein [Acinetobacter thermotolerans]|uniref:excalibur calcium-binding domain-containing protein n=2 Tax=Acinetobacter thermotolerans TaxID=3151487 RepID=UPI00325A6BFE